MHEMSIAESIVQILEQQADTQGYRRVTSIWLEIGPLAAIETSALQFCFNAATNNTLAEGARLHIINLEGKARCMHCGAEVMIQQRYDACSDCGSYDLQIIQGDEMRVKELEVE